MQHQYEFKSSVVSEEKADDNVKMEEDCDIFVNTDGNQPLPDAMDTLLSEPLTFQTGKHEYFGWKTKVSAQRSQRQHKVAQNACRHQQTRTMVKGTIL